MSWRCALGTENPDWASACICCWQPKLNPEQTHASVSSQRTVRREPSEEEFTEQDSGDGAGKRERVTAQAKYLRKWRKANPKYHRDWMRKYRGSPREGLETWPRRKTILGVIVN